VEVISLPTDGERSFDRWTHESCIPHSTARRGFYPIEVLSATSGIPVYLGRNYIQTPRLPFNRHPTTHTTKSPVHLPFAKQLIMISRLSRSLPTLISPLCHARIRTAVTVTSTRTNASAPLLANIEASWKDLASEEQYQVYQQLGELQKKDWKELSMDEKKAGE